MVKTRTWIVLISALLLLSLGLTLWLWLHPTGGRTANIYVDGELVRPVDLAAVEGEETFTVDTGRGLNVITVSEGRLRVSGADCPDKVCVNSGWLSGSAPIVCLPHRLVIKFADSSGGPDAVAG